MITLSSIKLYVKVKGYKQIKQPRIKGPRIYSDKAGSRLTLS